TSITLSLFALRRDRTAAILLGVGPALHPSIGLWCFGVLVLTCLLTFAASRDLRRETLNRLRRALPWFVVGVLVSTLSLIHQFHAARGIPHVPPEVKERFLRAYWYWDGHRAAVPLLSPDVLLTVLLIALGAMWLWRSAGDLPAGATFLLAAFVVS